MRLGQSSLLLSAALFWTFPLAHAQQPADMRTTGASAADQSFSPSADFGADLSASSLQNTGSGSSRGSRSTTALEGTAASSAKPRAYDQIRINPILAPVVAARPISGIVPSSPRTGSIGISSRTDLFSSSPRRSTSPEPASVFRHFGGGGSSHSISSGLSSRTGSGHSMGAPPRTSFASSSQPSYLSSTTRSRFSTRSRTTRPSSRTRPRGGYAKTPRLQRSARP